MGIEAIIVGVTGEKGIERGGIEEIEEVIEEGIEEEEEDIIIMGVEEEDIIRIGGLEELILGMEEKMTIRGMIKEIREILIEIKEIQDLIIIKNTKKKVIIMSIGKLQKEQEEESHKEEVDWE